MAISPLLNASQMMLTVARGRRRQPGHENFRFRTCVVSHPTSVAGRKPPIRRSYRGSCGVLRPRHSCRNPNGQSGPRNADRDMRVDESRLSQGVAIDIESRNSDAAFIYDREVGPSSKPPGIEERHRGRARRTPAGIAGIVDIKPHAAIVPQLPVYRSIPLPTVTHEQTVEPLANGSTYTHAVSVRSSTFWGRLIRT